MRTTQIESLSAIRHELNPLFELHYEFLEKDKDKVPMCFNDQLYENLEALGALLLVTIRQDGQLIGYFTGMVSQGMHSFVMTCTTDLFFVHPDHRQDGAGVQLFEAVQQELERRKVKRWYAGFRIEESEGAAALLNKQGFHPIEMYFVKWLGV